MLAKTLVPTAEYIGSILRLDPQTGQLFWRKPRSPINIGDEAGHCDKTGYRRVCIDRKMYLAHRIVFLLVHGRWPSSILDHIDQNPKNNRPENLRESNLSENGLNSKVRLDNTTGAKGLYLNPITNKWEIKKRGEYLGAWYNKAEAIDAYDNA